MIFLVEFSCNSNLTKLIVSEIVVIVQQEVKGRHKVFSTRQSMVTSTHIHVWCQSLMLNLGVTEATRVGVNNSSFFALLSNTDVFLREFYISELI